MREFHLKLRLCMSLIEFPYLITSKHMGTSKSNRKMAKSDIPKISDKLATRQLLRKQSQQEVNSNRSSKRRRNPSESQPRLHRQSGAVDKMNTRSTRARSVSIAPVPEHGSRRATRSSAALKEPPRSIKMKTTLPESVNERKVQVESKELIQKASSSKLTKNWNRNGVKEKVDKRKPPGEKTCRLPAHYAVWGRFVTEVFQVRTPELYRSLNIDFLKLQSFTERHLHVCCNLFRTLDSLSQRVSAETSSNSAVQWKVCCDLIRALLPIRTESSSTSVSSSVMKSMSFSCPIFQLKSLLYQFHRCILAWFHYRNPSTFGHKEVHVKNSYIRLIPEEKDVDAIRLKLHLDSKRNIQRLLGNSFSHGDLDIEPISSANFPFSPFAVWVPTPFETHRFLLQLSCPNVKIDSILFDISLASKHMESQTTIAYVAMGCVELAGYFVHSSSPQLPCCKSPFEQCAYHRMSLGVFLTPLDAYLALTGSLDSKQKETLKEVFVIACRVRKNILDEISVQQKECLPYLSAQCTATESQPLDVQELLPQYVLARISQEI